MLAEFCKEGWFQKECSADTRYLHYQGRISLKKKLTVGQLVTGVFFPVVALLVFRVLMMVLMLLAAGARRGRECPGGAQWLMGSSLLGN